MKYLLSFCFLLTLTTLTWAKSMNWGRRNATDYLLYSENVVRYPKNGYIQDIYVTYPKLGSRLVKPKNVTAIIVYDRFTNSSGATPFRAIPLSKTNNPRFNVTIIILRSQRSRGINSTVEFYGK